MTTVPTQNQAPGMQFGLDHNLPLSYDPTLYSIQPGKRIAEVPGHSDYYLRWVGQHALSPLVDHNNHGSPPVKHIKNELRLHYSALTDSGLQLPLDATHPAHFIGKLPKYENQWALYTLVSVIDHEAITPSTMSEDELIHVTDSLISYHEWAASEQNPNQLFFDDLVLFRQYGIQRGSGALFLIDVEPLMSRVGTSLAWQDALYGLRRFISYCNDSTYIRAAQQRVNALDRTASKLRSHYL